MRTIKKALSHQGQVETNWKFSISVDVLELLAGFRKLYWPVRTWTFGMNAKMGATSRWLIKTVIQQGRKQVKTAGVPSRVR